MSKNFTVVDQSTWVRTDHCKVFNGYVNPNLKVCFDLDITNFKNKVKEQGYSFTLAMTYAVCSVANQIENFRYRFQGDDVILYEECDSLFTFMNLETELFKMIYAPIDGSIGEFVKRATDIIENQDKAFTGSPGSSVFRCTAIPWISFTQFENAFSGKPGYSTPVFAWGKYTEKDGQITMPFAIQANHAFVDGVHMGKMAIKLQEYLDNYEG